ncbi:MAG: CRISPR-associated endonuclease Cas1 [Anaerolineae bacterium]|nr:CRISPR-associated endonuclease Cas1 [Anaerolineae bacterium]
MPVVKHLVADQFGTHIGKYSERLKLTQGGDTLAQAPLMHLQSVTIASMGVSISADAIAACCERGIPIVFMDGLGDVYASLYAAGLVGTVLTRRAQLLAYHTAHGYLLAAAISAAKIGNQAATLRYWARLRRESAPDQEPALLNQAADVLAYSDRIAALPVAPLDEARETLMGLEGMAARLYWDGAAQMIPAEYAWPGRIGRGATDPVNSLLNYGYGILYAQAERAVILAGLDPYAGFLHADRPGKPSLALDLVEEFRQIAVDRPVIGLLARRYAVPMDEHGRLADGVRRDFATKIVEHLDSPVRAANGANERIALRHAIQAQARQIAVFLRGELDAYTPFQAEG